MIFTALSFLLLIIYYLLFIAYYLLYEKVMSAGPYGIC